MPKLDGLLDLVWSDNGGRIIWCSLSRRLSKVYASLPTKSMLVVWMYTTAKVKQAFAKNIEYKFRSHYYSKLLQLMTNSSDRGKLSIVSFILALR